MKKIWGIMAFISIVLLLGIVGGVDAGTMPLGKGAALSFMCLGSLVGSTWLAGGFEK